MFASDPEDGAIADEEGRTAFPILAERIAGMRIPCTGGSCRSSLAEYPIVFPERGRRVAAGGSSLCAHRGRAYCDDHTVCTDALDFSALLSVI